MAETLKYRFAGHQTFAFRHGWLEKGVRGVHEYPTLFFEEDALIHLGVGKNMVSSIRHWCTVTQLIETDAGLRGAGTFSMVLNITAYRNLMSG